MAALREALEEVFRISLPDAAELDGALERILRREAGRTEREVEP